MRTAIRSGVPMCGRNTLTSVPTNTVLTIVPIPKR